MKRILAGLLVASLVGCTQPAPMIAPSDVFRDTSAQIASQTDVTAARMAGNWVIRQKFAGQPVGFDDLTLSVLPNGALQLAAMTRDCDGDVCTRGETLVLLAPSGPGRWTPTGDQSVLFDAELWVMWMDFDSRTAAIGTPTGEFGWIMDKNPTGGRDRIVAARDIMDWFGYDIDRLQMGAR